MKPFILLAWVSALCVAAEPPLQHLTGIADVMGKLPIGLELRHGKHWQPQAAALGTQALHEKVLGREIRVFLTIERLQRPENTAYGPALVGHVAENPLTVKGVTVEPRYHVYFTPDQLPKLGMTSTATHTLVTGKISRADFTEGGRVFNLDITQAKAGPQEAPQPVGGSFDQAKVEILSAIYGTGSNTADVTARVKQCVETIKINFSVTPASLGVDPAPGEHKDLTITYRKNGVQHVSRRTHTEDILWTGFYAPRTSDELAAWLPTVKWKGPQGEEFTFEKEGVMRSKTYAPTWRATDHNKLILGWAPHMQLECVFDWHWSSFTEQGGQKNKFTRVD